jgi:hypothetical protein
MGIMHTAQTAYFIKSKSYQLSFLGKVEWHDDSIVFTGCFYIAVVGSV